MPSNEIEIDTGKAIERDLRESIEHDLLVNNPEWLPIHSVWKWQNPSTRENFVTVAILLLSGIGDQICSFN